MSAWGGPHPEPPEPGEGDYCQRRTRGQACGKVITWTLTGDWRVGRWTHDDGTPRHRLFAFDTHPSTVTERPGSATDWDEQAVAARLAVLGQ